MTCIHQASFLIIDPYLNGFIGILQLTVIKYQCYTVTGKSELNLYCNPCSVTHTSSALFSTSAAVLLTAQSEEEANTLVKCRGSVA